MRGNEAKKLLKTKHIAFLSGANYACFARKLSTNMPSTLNSF